MKRKIVQLIPHYITFLGTTQSLRLYALCDDGSIWYRDCQGKDSTWKEVEDSIPYAQ